VFDSLAAELHRAGHHVQAVSGLEADGSTDVDRPPNLDAHIDQAAEIIDRGDSMPVALCRHSYAGMVIAGVADRLGARLEQLVFIDAYVPDDGDSCWSLTSDRFPELFIAGARADGRWIAVPEGLDLARDHTHWRASSSRSGWKATRVGCSAERSSAVERGPAARS
jgi:pimeloyl-ACP methyl ester carboxylesterase